MNKLYISAIAGLSFLTVVMVAAIFLATGTANYWQGWVFISVFFLSSTAITVYLALKDLKLLQRRVKAGPVSESEKSQKIIQSFSSLLFLSVIVVPALDHRLGWTTGLPTGFSIAGDLLVAFGFYLVFVVFRENTFTSSVIEVSNDQKVVSTGPYAVVRHPMYAGALLLLLGISPALGSWWGLLTLIPFLMILVWRLLDEEKFLDKNLEGYIAYRKKVKYRLIPFIW